MDKKPTFGQVMAGNKVTGVSPKTQPNANVENGEYLRTPDGQIMQAEGNTHENGGINLAMPDGTEVLSNSKEEMTVDKKVIKELKSTFELDNISTKDTYSNVLEKYEKKIGLSKLYKEEEVLFNKIDENRKKAMSEGSLRVNEQYLAKKVLEIQSQKAPLEEQMNELYSFLFSEQEESKEGVEVSEADPNLMQQPSEEEMMTMNQDPSMMMADPNQGMEELNQEQMFKLGGTIGEFKNLAKTYNLSYSKAFELLEKNNMLPKFSKGGEIGVTKNENKNYKKGVQKQSPNKVAYGNIQDAEDALQELYKNFPTVLTKEKFKNFITLEEGKVKVKEGVKLSTINEEFFGEFQKDANNYMKNSANYIIKNANKFSSDAVVEAERYLNEETFVDEKGNVRSLDGKLGEFSAGRYSMKLDLLTPEDLEKVNNSGIWTLKQLKNNPELYNQLSEESKNRVSVVEDELPEDSDFSLSKFTFDKAKTPTDPARLGEAPNDPSETPEGKKIVDDINDPTGLRRRNRLFQMPDQSYLPPLGLQAEGLYQVNLGRTTPVTLGIEDTLRQNQRNTQFVASQLQNLPPTVAQGILANMMAQQQQSENQAINQVHQINAQNISQADQFNIAQADRESTINSQAKLDYENRALLGLSKTDNDFRNWYNANREININNYQQQLNMNTLSNLFPKYGISADGANVVFDPISKSYVRKYNPMWAQAVSTLGANRDVEDEEDKKKTNKK